MNITENAEAYWASRKYKVWHVDVTSGASHAKVLGFRPFAMYVRAATRNRAEHCAKANCFTTSYRPLRFAARLATPFDLGCVPTPAKEAA